MRIGAGLEIDEHFPLSILKDNITIACLSTDKETIRFYAERDFSPKELFAIARAMTRVKDGKK